MKRWTDSEKHRLRQLCGTMPISEVAKKLGRPEQATRSAAFRAGISFACQESKRIKLQARHVEMARTLHEAGYGSDAIKRFADNASEMSASGIEKIISYETQPYARGE